MYVSLLQLRPYESKQGSHIAPPHLFKLVLSFPISQYRNISSIRQMWLLFAAPVLLLYHIPLHQVQVLLLTKVHGSKLPDRFQARLREPLLVPRAHLPQPPDRLIAHLLYYA